MHVISHYMMMVSFFCFGQVLTRQMSLANRHLKIGAQAWPPLLVIEKNDRGQDTISGPVGDYLKYLSQARNCSFTIVTPPEGASIKYVRTKGEGGGSKKPENMRTIVLIGCVKSVQEGGGGPKCRKICVRT